MNNQLIFDFPTSKIYLKEDFYITGSNSEVFNYLDSWPKWSKNMINIFGPHGSGKSHLASIFNKKVPSVMLDCNKLSNNIFIELKSKQALIIENLRKEVPEDLLYSIFNTINQENKYLVITSLNSINSYNFTLPDLNSRIKSMLGFEIKLPDDNLIFVILLKSFSDRQIKVEKKIIEYIIKRIDRSYESISKFVSLLDKNSLAKGKSFNYKIIDETLKKVKGKNKK